MPFLGYVPGIMSFLKTCWNEEERTDLFCSSFLGLVGDFGTTYQEQVKNDLMQEWVQQAISLERRRGASKTAKMNAAYAQRVSRSALRPNICLTLRRSRNCQNNENFSQNES